MVLSANRRSRHQNMPWQVSVVRRIRQRTGVDLGAGLAVHDADPGDQRRMVVLSHRLCLPLELEGERRNLRESNRTGRALERMRLDLDGLAIVRARQSAQMFDPVSALAAER